MKIDRLFGVGLILALLVLSIPGYIIGGRAGFFSYLLGIASGAGSFTILFILADAMGKASANSQKRKKIIALLLMTLIAKFPIIGFASQAAARLGEPGPGCFGTALVLVYSAAIILVVASGNSSG